MCSQNPSEDRLLSIDELDRGVVNLAEWLHWRCDQ